MPEQRVKTQPNYRPGPVYDTGMRETFEGDPGAACRLMDIPVTTDSGVPQVLSGSFPAVTRSVDLLLEVGPARLVHVEYVTRVESDLVARLINYRELIMLASPGKVLQQVVIVLGAGRVSGHDDLAAQGFCLDLKIIYLREMDPELFLGGASLAPLAALGRGGPGARAEAYRRALQLIHERAGPRVKQLLTCATELAGVTLERSIIRSIIEEVAMSVKDEAEYFRDLPWGETLIRVGREEGRQEGIEQGLEQGLEQGVGQALTWMLRQRFGAGNDYRHLAQRLATWPDPDSAFRAITAAESLADLKKAQPPA